MQLDIFRLSTEKNALEELAGLAALAIFLHTQKKAPLQENEKLVLLQSSILVCQQKTVNPFSSQRQDQQL